VFTSSGAALNAYSTWGAYGSSKAAMNHLAKTLRSEEPDIVAVAVRPGTVDTDMQKSLRNEYAELMDAEDKAKFANLKKNGQLLRPDQPGNVMARLALNAPTRLSGQFLRCELSSMLVQNADTSSWNNEVLKEFQD
jgi:NAD(P)-dependent dehydrogenase (short-subunit alcohol dehydrogenase family)